MKWDFDNNSDDKNNINLRCACYAHYCAEEGWVYNGTTRKTLSGGTPKRVEAHIAALKECGFEELEYTLPAMPWLFSAEELESSYSVLHAYEYWHRDRVERTERWRNSHNMNRRKRRMQVKEEAAQRLCVICNEPIPASARADKIVCSTRCRVALHRARVAAE